MRCGWKTAWRLIRWLLIGAICTLLSNGLRPLARHLIKPRAPMCWPGRPTSISTPKPARRTGAWPRCGVITAGLDAVVVFRLTPVCRCWQPNNPLAYPKPSVRSRLSLCYRHRTIGSSACVIGPCWRCCTPQACAYLNWLAWAYWTLVCPTVLSASCRARVARTGSCRLGRRLRTGLTAI